MPETRNQLITAITRTLLTDDDRGRRGPNAPAALTMRIAKPQDSQHGESAENTVFTEPVCPPAVGEARWLRGHRALRAFSGLRILRRCGGARAAVAPCRDNAT